MTETTSTDPIDRVLLGAEEIDRRVRALGAEIGRDYAGRDLAIVGVLTGAAMFACDLIRHIPLSLTIDFMSVSSYGSSTRSSGVVRIIQDVQEPITGRDVLLVEDIADTGLTLSFLLDTLRTRGPASLRSCALLDKPSRRERPVTVDYVGFTIPNEFVVGYGLDYKQRYRNLPYIGVLRPPAE
jgi:hypoxanthine phosphoribosyltransferase